MGFGGFDSSIMLCLRGGILISMGDFLESLSQAMLVGVMLVGRLGVQTLCGGDGVLYVYESMRLVTVCW